MFDSSEVKERFRKALELSEALVCHLANTANIKIMASCFTLTII